MNNKFDLKAMLRIAGIIAIVAMIGLSMAACEDEVGCSVTHGGDSAKITLTGTGAKAGNFVFLSLDTKYYGYTIVPSNGQVIVDMLCWECDEPDFKAGNYALSLRIDESSQKGSTTLYEGTIANKNIPAGNSTIQLNDFTHTQHSGASAKITLNGTGVDVGNFVFLSLNDTQFYGYTVVASAGTVSNIEMLCWKCDEPDFKAGTYKVSLRIDANSTKGSQTLYEGTIANKAISAGNSTIQFNEFTQN